MTNKIDKYYKLDLPTDKLPDHVWEKWNEEQDVTPKDIPMTKDDTLAFQRMVARFFLQRPHLYHDPEFLSEIRGMDSDGKPIVSIMISSIYNASDVPNAVMKSFLGHCGGCGAEIDEQHLANGCAFCGDNTVLSKEHENV